MAIKEAKELKKLTLKKFLGSLISYEKTLQDDKEENKSFEKKKDLAFKLMLEDSEVNDDENVL